MAQQDDLNEYTALGGPYPDLFASFPPAERRLLLDLMPMLARLPYGLSIALGNLKGGVGKSTTSVYLALILGLLGRRVLLVDADGSNLTVTKWCDAAGELWPATVRVVPWGAKDNEDGTGLEGVTPTEMGERIGQARGKFDDLIVDVGPQREAYLRAALRHVKDFIVLSGQYSPDTDQIIEAVQIAVDVVKKYGIEIFTTVLFTRVNRRASSYEAAVAELETRRVVCFDDVIPTADHYGMAANQVPLKFGEYLGVLTQLVESHLDAVEVQA